MKLVVYTTTGTFWKNIRSEQEAGYELVNAARCGGFAAHRANSDPDRIDFMIPYHTITHFEIERA